MVVTSVIKPAAGQCRWTTSCSGGECLVGAREERKQRTDDVSRFPGIYIIGIRFPTARRPQPDSRLPTRLRSRRQLLLLLLSFLSLRATTTFATTTFTDMAQHPPPSAVQFRHEVVTEGSGSAVIVQGSAATVHAEGAMINADGSLKKFWSTRDPGQKPFTWKAGLGQVIAGWDQGVLGMKKGEVRKIFIPSSMGYGASGFPAWGISPNANLHFTIECLSIDGS